MSRIDDRKYTKIKGAERFIAVPNSGADQRMKKEMCIRDRANQEAAKSLISLDGLSDFKIPKVE